MILCLFLLEQPSFSKVSIYNKLTTLLLTCSFSLKLGELLFLPSSEDWIVVQYQWFNFTIDFYYNNRNHIKFNYIELKFFLRLNANWALNVKHSLVWLEHFLVLANPNNKNMAEIKSTIWQ